MNLKGTLVFTAVTAVCGGLGALKHAQPAWPDERRPTRPGQKTAIHSKASKQSAGVMAEAPAAH